MNSLTPDITKLAMPSNDWFHMKPECKNGEYDDCNENEYATNNFQKSADHLGATITQYNDAKMLYNRELLFTVNILAGLAMLCYYIYLNQSAIPSSPMVAINSIGDISKSFAGVAAAPFQNTAASIR